MPTSTALRIKRTPRLEQAPQIQAIAAALPHGPWTVTAPEQDYGSDCWTLGYAGTDPDLAGYALWLTWTPTNRLEIAGRSWCQRDEALVRLEQGLYHDHPVRLQLCAKITLTTQQPATKMAQLITTRFLVAHQDAWRTGLALWRTRENERIALNAYMHQLATVLQTERIQLATSDGTEATVSSARGVGQVQATFRASGTLVRLEYLTLTRDQALAIAACLASFTPPQETR